MKFFIFSETFFFLAFAMRAKQGEIREFFNLLSGQSRVDSNDYMRKFFPATNDRLSIDRRQKWATKCDRWIEESERSDMKIDLDLVLAAAAVWVLYWKLKGKFSFFSFHVNDAALAEFRSQSSPSTISTGKISHHLESCSMRRWRTFRSSLGGSPRPSQVNDWNQHRKHGIDSV